MSARILLFNKPYQVLCQFTPVAGKKTLADYIDVAAVYACGRLDYLSEGLLVLTNDGQLQAKISNPRYKQYKRYLVQVEHIPSDKSLQMLASGVPLKDGMTLPAKVRRLEQPKWLWPRQPPIRQRRDIPTQWLELDLREGKNRQVRRMTASIGHPTLRLIRTQVAAWTLDDLTPGSYRNISI